MNKYFLFTPKNASNITSAFAPEETKLSYELIPELVSCNKLPFELKLVKITIGKKGIITSDDLTGVENLWFDCESSSLAWPLMSERLKALIESYLTGTEGVDWIQAIVKYNEERQKYYIMRFAKMLDVLDMQKTLFREGTTDVLRPVFSLTKIRDYAVFSRPTSYDFWRIPSGIYMNESLKRAIQKAKLTGTYFKEVLVKKL